MEKRTSEPSGESTSNVERPGQSSTVQEYTFDALRSLLCERVDAARQEVSRQGVQTKPGRLEKASDLWRQEIKKFTESKGVRGYDETHSNRLLDAAWKKAKTEYEKRSMGSGVREDKLRLLEALRRADEKLTPSKLKEEMSHVFRTGGYIQLLAEEKFTFTVIDWTMAHPELKDKFMNMLQRDIPEHHPLSPTDNGDRYRSRVQTALAFQYACELGPSSKSLGSDVIHVAGAEEAIKHVEAMKEDILKDPDTILFLSTNDRDNSRENMTRIDAGTVSPQKAWDSREGTDVRVKIERELRKANLQENIPAAWAQRKDIPHTRYVLGLSSLRLPYQGQSLKSLEQIKYTRASGDTYITSKFTTMDDRAYYAPETMYGDVSYRISERVPPFLSGAEYEEDTTATRQALSNRDWQGEDRDWRFSGENRGKYYNDVHPAIAHYTHSVIEYLARQGKKEVTILDIAGGNGDLGERIIKDTQARFPDLSIKYRLVDYSQEDVNTANERFRTLNAKNADHVTASAICKDMFAYNFDAEQMKHDADIGLPQEGADIIISSGGLLNKLIAGDAEVPVKFNRMYANLMSKGGFGIYSGLTHSFINSTHHKENGMEIRNLYDMHCKNQMHVVRRPED